MIEYKGQLNMGNEALQSEKTITANEVLRTCDAKALAREIHHQNSLIPEQVATAVLENFCKAAAEKMAEGFAIQLNAGDEVAIRIFPDIHIKGGNINLARAKELDPSVTELTEGIIGSLIDKAGVQVRVRATCMSKFTDMLENEGARLTRVGVETKAYIQRKGDSDEETDEPANGGSTNSGDNNGDNNGGGVTPPGGNTGNDD